MGTPNVTWLEGSTSPWDQSTVCGNGSRRPAGAPGHQEKDVIASHLTRRTALSEFWLAGIDKAQQDP